MSKKLEQAQERGEARKYLLGLLKPGDTVYTVLHHVSKSGMSRDISLLVRDDSGVTNISWAVARVCGERLSPKYGIRVGGCGMDMGFHLVYNLGRCLWPNGTEAPHGTRNGESAPSGGYPGSSNQGPANAGYALKHRWL